MEIKLGSYTSSSADVVAQRLSMLIWGVSGSGKTELALTAPGKKLFLNFDANGMQIAANRDDVVAFDLSAGGSMLVEQLKQPDPLSITKTLTEHPELESVIVDSTTAIQEMALTHGISNVKAATLTNPTQQGYMYRKAYTIEFVKNLLNVTARLNRHVIFIAHEDEPVVNDEGITVEIPIMIGGKARPVITAKIAEIWNLTEVKGKQNRVIAVRPCRSRKPMVTRMFNPGTALEFEWKYDANTRQGDGIAQWYEQWKNNGFNKIPLPT